MKSQLDTFRKINKSAELDPDNDLAFGEENK